MARSTRLSIDEVWNSVALEERLELISRAHAYGTVSATAFMLFIGSVAYGFDQIWLLAGGAVGAALVFSIFASYCWRRGRPALILSYLAVRSVARRYAYGYGVPELDIILIFRGTMDDYFETREEAEIYKQHQAVDFDRAPNGAKPVWVCLLRGAVVLLSERQGGAKLEFLSAINPEMDCKKAPRDDDRDQEGILIKGSGLSRTRRVIITSRYGAALYVFEKQLGRLINEVIAAAKKLENVRNTLPE